MVGTSDPGSTGVGQLDPFDSTSDFSVIAFIVRMMMSQLDTMKLVKVVGVTGGGGAIAKAGTVDVQPLVSLIDGAGNATPQGVVYGIPWWRLQSGANAVICDPVVGDIGYVLCADRDTSGVLAAAGAGKESLVSTPGSYRQMNIADGIYVGGVLNKIPERYIAFTADSIKIADQNGNVIEMTPDGIKLTGEVTVQGNLFVTGDVKALSGGAEFVTLLDHRHPANFAPPLPGS